MRQREYWPITAALCACLALVALGGCGGGAVRRADDERAVHTNLGLAESYMRNGDYETALAKLKKAEQIDPQSADVQSMLGLLYASIRRPEQADEYYHKSVKLGPRAGGILNNYATWLCRSGRSAESLEWFDRALDDPFYKTQALALSNAGRCAVEAGQLERADGYFRRAIELDGSLRDVLQDMAALSFQRGDLMRARAFVQRREAAGTVGPQLLELAEKVEDGLGDKEAAKRYRNRLIKEFPEFRSSLPGATNEP